MAKLKKDIYGVVKGEIYPKTIEAGEECPVELEDIAVEVGAITEKQRTKPIDAPADETGGTV